MNYKMLFININLDKIQLFSSFIWKYIYRIRDFYFMYALK